jgi:hypothetical protein
LDDIHDRKCKKFQTNQSLNNTQMMHPQMKTKHLDVEEDLSLDDASLMRYNFNGGGKGHVCKSEHEIGWDRVRSSLFLSSLGLFATRSAQQFSFVGGLL